MSSHISCRKCSELFTKKVELPRAPGGFKYNMVACKGCCTTLCCKCETQRYKVFSGPILSNNSLTAKQKWEALRKASSVHSNAGDACPVCSTLMTVLYFNDDQGFTDEATMRALDTAAARSSDSKPAQTSKS